MWTDSQETDYLIGLQLLVLAMSEHRTRTTGTLGLRTNRVTHDQSYIAQNISKSKLVKTTSVSLWFQSGSI